MATRQALVDAARELFAARGYAETSTELVVQHAGVTRGALYHHFADKRAVFGAVFDAAAQDIVAHVTAAHAPAPNRWEELRRTSHSFLDACTRSATLRIVFIDAPSVLGWERWRSLDEDFGMKLIYEGLQQALDADEISRHPVKPLAHLLLAVLIEGALLVAHAADQTAARAEVDSIVDGILSSLRTSS